MAFESCEPSQEYKINIFDIKLISQEENVANAEGQIFPLGHLEIKDLESGQVYTLHADEKGEFQGFIPLTGDKGFENIVFVRVPYSLFIPLYAFSFFNSSHSA